MTMPSAVLFDMDGTLTDTEPLWLIGETRTMAAFGYTWTSEDQHNCFGLPIPVVSQYMESRAGGVSAERIIAELMDTMDELMRTRFAWSPGSRELLLEVLAAGMPTALVSASWRRLVDANVLQMRKDLACDVFEVSVAGDEVSAGKPHPMPYLMAAQRLGVHCEDCLIIEDSPAGVASALATGAQVLGIEHLASLGNHPRLRVVASLAGVRLGQLTSGIGGGVPPQAGQMD